MKKCRHCQDKELLAICPVSKCSWEILDLNSYRIINKSSYYDDAVARIVGKWEKRLQVEMKSHIFDSLDPTPIVSSPSALSWRVILTEYKMEPSNRFYIVSWRAQGPPYSTRALHHDLSCISVRMNDLSLPPVSM